MSEPSYIRQSEVKGDASKRRWFLDAQEEAASEGCVFFRCSYHPVLTDLLLLEGWKTRPKEQGEPRFSLTLKEQSDV